jgi:dihydropteroate synthase
MQHLGPEVASATPAPPVKAGLAQVMAILNLTPDSFSDGGRLGDPAAALAAARQAEADGAAWLDLGGESSRPGAEPVAAAVELDRVLPVVEALHAGSRLPLSIDTAKAAVAAAALQAGCAMVNDISAGRDPEMFTVVAAAGVPYVLMHMHGEPRTMQAEPRYDDVVDAVLAFFHHRMQAAITAGLAEERIVLDPGIGFGKTTAHNLSLLRALPRLRRETGRPLLIGLSRKRFLPQVMGRELPPEERDGWSHAFHALIARDCDLLRVHDVPGAVAAVRAAAALAEGGAAA